MQTAKTGRLVFLGTPSEWVQQVMGALQQTAGFEIQFENDVAKYLAVPIPKNRVGVGVLELANKSRQSIEAIRKTGRRMILVWVGKTFTKEDLQFAMEQRIHTVVENPAGDNPAVHEQFRKAVARAEESERAEDLMFSIKSVLLQLGEGEAGPLLTELKTGFAKFERNSMQSDFIGQRAVTTGEARVPFHKGQSFSEAMMTIQDLERTGVLVVKSNQPGLEGQVGFLQGRPVSARCGEARSLKAIYRMFSWEEPHYTFNRAEASETRVEEQFPVSLREICLEGESLHRRFDKIRSQVPPANIRLGLEPSSLQLTTELDRNHFDTLSSVVELGKVSQILDYNPLPDVVLFECLITLKRNGVIKVA